MSVVAEAIHAAVAREDLAGETMERAMEEILGGQASPVQIAALAVALRMKGETATEIAAAARVMRRRATPVHLQVEGPLLDTCGTGGDGVGSFNVSTVSAIVVAAGGVRVAKHGNRAVSSRAGSADVLETLGVRLDLTPDEVARQVRDLGIGFLFAPAFHAALRHAAPVRRELGLRTFFNLLGPLANPAGATHQLVGVYDGSRVRQMAEVLGKLGLEAAWVVHGEGGLDELSPFGTTRVAKLADGQVTETTLRAADFGLDEVAPESLAGGDAGENAAIARRLLAGEGGPHRTTVLMNAGAAFCVVGRAASPAEGAALAARAIDSGAALSLLEAWVGRGGAA